MTETPNPAVERAKAANQLLLASLRQGQPTEVRIPGWEPVDLAQGLRWLEASIWEGFEVDWRIARSEALDTVWMRIWEPGEEPPIWETAPRP